MSTQGEDGCAPSIEEIRRARERLGARVRRTPVWRWENLQLEALLGTEAEVILKLELFQYAGSFKPRGAMLNIMALDDDALKRGVTAVSAGNHAMAVSFAAAELETTAKVVMPENADASRVDACRKYGAEVVLERDVHSAFDEVRRIEREEGRTFVHPFEGRLTVTGTATVGLELMDDVPDLDAVIVPIGGGGLCAGVAAAVKQTRPECLVYGVEPTGSDVMSQSLAAGRPLEGGEVHTIADSLGAPHTAPYSFSICRRWLDEVVLVDDDALRDSMKLLFEGAKLAVEPAGAAATAALVGPLAERLRDKRVGLIVCGANISPATFAAHLSTVPAGPASDQHGAD
ncbi:MAG: threonine/serine dehydratase [Acidobacteriota bacterium]|nr:threonine/serine dehydratase [Acidobacteriota bacterium]